MSLPVKIAPLTVKQWIIEEEQENNDFNLEFDEFDMLVGHLK